MSITSRLSRRRKLQSDFGLRKTKLPPFVMEKEQVMFGVCSLDSVNRYFLYFINRRARANGTKER